MKIQKITQQEEGSEPEVRFNVILEHAGLYAVRESEMRELKAALNLRNDI